MKKFYSALAVVFAVHFTVANPAINSVPSSGDWKSPSTWSLGRLPVNGDTVVIAAGKTVMIDDIENLSNEFLYLKIYGVLVFSNGKLWINNSSSVFIFSGGAISSTGSPSETLKIGAVDKYVGTDGTISGPMFANQTTSASPLGFISGIVLPVKFVGFNLARQDNSILVQWEAVEEMNSSYYEIQRSTNGNDWTTISNVAASSNTTTSHSYSYIDRAAAATLLYYRIRQVDIDGKFVMTPVRTIKNENGYGEVRISAASANSICINFSEQVKGNVIVRLTSSSGQIVSQKTFDQPVGQVMMFNQSVNKGVYVVTIADGQGLKFSKQVLL
jgi:hypothetical protein